MDPNRSYMERLRLMVSYTSLEPLSMSSSKSKTTGRARQVIGQYLRGFARYVESMREEEERVRPMRRQRNRWWFILVLILPMAIGGCDPSRQSSKPSLTDNGRFMDMWGIYTHCSQSEDLDAMRIDAQRLSLAVDVMDPAADPIPAESEELAPMEPSVRLSADPAAMAAACTLRAGQVAQGMGRLSFARQMFQMIVTNFPQPRYRYYVAQAREGLESLDAARSG